MFEKRSVLRIAATIPLLLLLLTSVSSGLDAQQSEDWAEKARKFEQEALTAFPYEYLKVEGHQAMGEWELLQAEPGVSPVIIGGEESFKRIVEVFHPKFGREFETSALLQKASDLEHPDSIFELRKAEEERLAAYYEENPAFKATIDALREKIRESENDVDRDPAVTWLEDLLKEYDGEPSSRSDAHIDQAPQETLVPEDLPGVPSGLTVTQDWRNGRPYPEVYIVLLPTDDWTEIPAYLRWGAWNANPSPEYHVAALRSWRDRYGAELVGMSPDVLNLRVANPPASLGESLVLAREQYAYCSDIVSQGVGTVAALATELKDSNWWYFWWD